MNKTLKQTMTAGVMALGLAGLVSTCKPVKMYQTTEEPNGRLYTEHIHGANLPRTYAVKDGERIIPVTRKNLYFGMPDGLGVGNVEDNPKYCCVGDNKINGGEWIETDGKFVSMTKKNTLLGSTDSNWYWEQR